MLTVVLPQELHDAEKKATPFRGPYQQGVTRFVMKNSPGVGTSEKNSDTTVVQRCHVEAFMESKATPAIEE